MAIPVLFPSILMIPETLPTFGAVLCESLLTCYHQNRLHWKHEIRWILFADDGMAGTSPPGRAGTCTAEDLDRRRDDRRHDIATKRTDPFSPADGRSLTARKHHAQLRLHGLRGRTHQEPG